MPTAIDLCTPRIWQLALFKFNKAAFTMIAQLISTSGERQPGSCRHCVCISKTANSCLHCMIASLVLQQRVEPTSSECDTRKGVQRQAVLVQVRHLAPASERAGGQHILVTSRCPTEEGIISPQDSGYLYSPFCKVLGMCAV